jgi:hypothetical protein
MTDTNNSEVIKLRNIGRLMRRGNCAKCGGSVAGIVKADTPYDRMQTKKEYDEAQAKKTKKKENFLTNVATKVKKEPVATVVKKKANPTKASQKKLVDVPKPALKQRDGESKKEYNARVERVWSKRKEEAVA